MAYNFLGTIKSREEFDEFEEFITVEVSNIEKRLDRLQSESARISELIDKFRKADYTLRAPYSLSKDVTQSWITVPRPFNIKSTPAIDSLNAVDVGALKTPFLDTIKFRRERNEFKLKKLLDLLEQMSNEMAALEEIRTTYTDHLDKIKARFDMKDFVEVQPASVDPADEISGIKEKPSDLGIVIINGITYYLVLTINGATNTICFEGNAPALKPGDKITLSNGANNGIKTVKRVMSGSAIQTVEVLKTESKPATRVAVG